MYELEKIINELSSSDKSYSDNTWTVNHSILTLNDRYPKQAYKYFLPIAKNKNHRLHNYIIKLRKSKLPSTD